MVKEFTTYSPFTGGIYDGGPLGTFDFTYEDIVLDRKIAEVQSTPYQMSASRQGLSHPDIVDSPINGNKFTYTLSASMRKQAKALDLQSKLNYAKWGADDDPVRQVQIAQALKNAQLQADIDTNVSHVRVIPRIPKILGLPPSIYYLEAMFTPQMVEKLDARIAEQDAIGIELQKEPTQPTGSDKTQFIEHKFSLKRNTLSLVWSSESLRRADADIKAIDFKNASIAKAKARELLALIEFSKLSDSTKITIPDIKAKSTDVALPRSRNDPVEKIAEAIMDFNVNRSSNLTHIAFNPLDFLAISRNYYMMQRAFTFSDYQGYGVVQMPNMPMITAVISPFVPRKTAYAVDKSQVFMGEGPFVTEMERDAKIYADRAYMHDFVQFLIPNKKRFGLKIVIEDSTATAGTEITSLEQAQKLATPAVTLESETYVDGSFK